jgi:hypothetical protein
MRNIAWLQQSCQSCDTNRTLDALKGVVEQGNPRPATLITVISIARDLDDLSLAGESSTSSWKIEGSSSIGFKCLPPGHTI